MSVVASQNNLNTLGFSNNSWFILLPLSKCFYLWCEIPSSSAAKRVLNRYLHYRQMIPAPRLMSLAITPARVAEEVR